MSFRINLINKEQSISIFFLFVPHSEVEMKAGGEILNVLAWR